MGEAIGLAGVALILIAVAVLAGIWWAVLLAGGVLVGVGYLTHTAPRPPVRREPERVTE